MKLNHETILTHSARLGENVLDLEAKGVDAKGQFIDWNITNNYQQKLWTIIVFYPADFTFVCPTEIRKVSELASEFTKNNAQVVVASVDSPFVHQNWRESSLGKINIPMLSDQNHLLSRYFNIYSANDGLAWRGTFIISPTGKLYVNYSTFGEVGRSAKEILRLLQASQAADEGKLMPCEWNPGDDTIKVK